MASSDYPSTELDNIGIRKYLSENLDNLSGVCKFHKQSLESCEEECAQWKKFIKGYNVLKEKLTTFPDKTSYETMVPIGSMAYMKGRQIHTNEILVHLGDNWFTERSAKDAIAIIDRRKQVCEDNLKSAEKRCDIHKNWITLISEFPEKEGNRVEILEEVSEDEYQRSIEKHKEMVARNFAALEKQKKEGSEDLGNISSVEEETVKFEDLLKKLDELEEIERLQDDLDERGEDVDSEENPENDPEKSREEITFENEAIGREKLRRRVSWADQIRDAVNDEEDEEEDAVESAKIKYGRQKSLPSELIHTAEDYGKMQETEPISPSLVLKDKDEEESESSGEPETPDSCEILEDGMKKITTLSPQSPSDIYKMFGTRGVSPAEPPPKGILKKKGGDSFNAEETEKGVGWNDETETVTYIPNSPDEEILIPLNPPLSESPREIKNLKSAFSYKVIAKGEEGSEECSAAEAVENSETQNAEEPKRVSRFKASRMKK